MRTEKRCLLLAAAIWFLAGLAGCASPGVPQPPSLNLPQPVNDLAAARKGDRAVLTWSPPNSTTDRGPIRRPGLIRICRVVNEYPMSSCGAVVKELHPSDLVSAAPESQRPQVAYEDAIPANLLGANAEATYAVEVFNDRGRSAGLSNQVRVSLAPTLPPAIDFHASLGAQGVTLTWNAIPANTMPESSTVTYHYNLWRRLAGTREYTDIESVPLSGSEQKVTDPSFEWEKTYEYKVTPVTVIAMAGRPALEVEGDDSPVVKMFVHDVFPPATPTGVQAVFSGVGQKPFVDLTWDPNTEPDLAGYDVFRKAGNQPEQKLNTELLRAPSFRDPDIIAGTRYAYTVQAVDLRGNRSARSAETTEVIPK